jgi:hypothetical protein
MPYIFLLCLAVLLPLRAAAATASDRVQLKVDCGRNVRGEILDLPLGDETPAPMATCPRVDECPSMIQPAAPKPAAVH